MTDMKRTDLDKAYSPVPDGFHDALFSAVHSIREEEPVKKRHISLLAAILIIALLCGTAFAIASHYSVRDLQAQGKPSAEFEKHIVEIDQTYENEYITLNVGDAVFDGVRFAVAMSLESKDESKPVYLYPSFAGYCNGRQLSTDIEGMRGDFLSGFMYPNIVDGDTLDHQYGFDGVVFEDTVDGDVEWVLTLQLIAPNWPVANDETVLTGTDADPTAEEYDMIFQDAYANKQILSTEGESLYSYVAVNTPDYGASERTFGEEIAALDAFTLVDTIECRFTTSLPEVTTVKDKEFAFDGYTIKVNELNCSFMQVKYDLTKTFTEKQTAGHDRELGHYELRDQDGNPLMHMSTGWELDDTGRVLSIIGESQTGESALTAVTFVPYHYNIPDEWDSGITYDESQAFTVELK